MGMAEEVLDDLRGRIAKTLDDLRRELAKVRTGRANPALLEGVRVDYYGTMSPLQNVANVTVADPRLIVIKPWEKSMIQVIEKAINAAGLGVNAMSDAELVRVPGLLHHGRHPEPSGLREQLGLLRLHRGEHDRDPGEARIASYLLQELNAIHPRHQEIEENHVEVAAGIGELCEGCPSIARRRELVLTPREGQAVHVLHER